MSFFNKFSNVEFTGELKSTDSVPLHSCNVENSAFILYLDFYPAFVWIKAQANEDTLLPTQMFPRLPARAAFVADTNFVSGTQKMFLILFRHFVSATSISQFAQPKKHHGQQCVFVYQVLNLPGKIVTLKL